MTDLEAFKIMLDHYGGPEGTYSGVVHQQLCAFYEGLKHQSLGQAITTAQHKAGRGEVLFFTIEDFLEAYQEANPPDAKDQNPLEGLPERSVLLDWVQDIRLAVEVKSEVLAEALNDAHDFFMEEMFRRLDKTA